MKTRYILTIAGSDILSGGGLQADLATFTVSGLFGFVAQTCMTSVDSGDFDIIPTAIPVFAKQLKSLADVPFAGIKLGLLPSRELAEQVGSFIQEHDTIPVVLDPVLVFKENNDDAISTMRQEMLNLLPYVTVVTPNLRESEILSGMTITTLSDMKKAAQILYDLGAKNVIVKGGTRLDKYQAIDLFYDGREMLELVSPILHRNNNGAGCSFAARIASNLALGRPPLEAIQEAKAFVYQAIKNSNNYGVVQQYEKF